MYNTASLNVISKLLVGDTLGMELQLKGALYAENQETYTTFSAFLLYEDN